MEKRCLHQCRSYPAKIRKRPFLCKFGKSWPRVDSLWRWTDSWVHAANLTSSVLTSFHWTPSLSPTDNQNSLKYSVSALLQGETTHPLLSSSHCKERRKPHCLQAATQGPNMRSSKGTLCLCFHVHVRARIQHKCTQKTLKRTKHKIPLFAIELMRQLFYSQRLTLTL